MTLALLLGSILGSWANSPVTVTNPTALQRTDETVELSWKQVAAKVKGVMPSTIVVLDAQGKQVPSQVVYNGHREPQTLIFQATVAPNGSASYTLASGKRENYKAQAYGRYVPERRDDYAWENNLVAFRAYGPSLEDETITPGLDVWMKRTPEMIVNKWFREDLAKISTYHKDTGEGADVYKVGLTLGAGGAAPFIGGKLRFPDHNYQSQRTLDNGPIRTTVLFTYGPYKIGELTVSYEKEISLDANTHFNKVTEVYGGNFKEIPLAAGMVVHQGAEKKVGSDYVALMEPASDSKTGTDGNIALAVIVPQMTGSANADESLLATATATNGKPFVYYNGAGWSKYGVPDLKSWIRITEEQAQKIKNPLQVSFK